MSTKILQISSEVNVGSVGKIAEQIGCCIINEGWESYIAYGRDISESQSQLFQIGNNLDILQHVLYTRLSDKHGFDSKKVTEKLINRINELKPDILHLHHLHGYFINVKVLFEHLETINIPIVWTFHDCWSFTGHCAIYENIGCEKWKIQCEKCPQKSSYPQSWFRDNSKQNYLEKKRLFNLPKNITIVPVSKWIENEVRHSFLNNHKIHTIRNGIDLDVFKYTESFLKDKLNLFNKKIILGVAFVWSETKGFNDFLKLSQILSDDYRIILLGLNKRQITNLPKNIIGIETIQNQSKLAEFYSLADVFFNPTKGEALGLTNIEALACGTPVITYNSGGSIESIFDNLGFVVEKNNITEVKNKIEILISKSKHFYRKEAREKVMCYFDKEKQFNEYINLYKVLMNIY